MVTSTEFIFSFRVHDSLMAYPQKTCSAWSLGLVLISYSLRLGQTVVEQVKTALGVRERGRGEWGGRRLKMDNI